VNTETITVLAFVLAVFGAFYVISAKAERWVKGSYEEKRREEEARGASRGKKR